MDFKVAANMFFADSCVGRDRDLAIEFAEKAYEVGKQEALEHAAQMFETSPDTVSGETVAMRLRILAQTAQELTPEQEQWAKETR